jgi:hypothetical protein
MSESRADFRADNFFIKFKKIHCLEAPSSHGVEEANMWVRSGGIHKSSRAVLHASLMDNRMVASIGLIESYVMSWVTSSFGRLISVSNTSRKH